MNKIDLIIENIEYAKILKEGSHQDELLEEALAAARELRAMKPEGISPINGVSLYALDEVKHD